MKPLLEGQFDIDITVGIRSRFNELTTNDYLREIAKNLEAEHAAIEMSDRIKGVPVIKGTRLSVAQLLGRIFVLESIDAVVEFYRGTISKDQIKAAVAFAQDFLEAACEPLQANG